MDLEEEISNSKASNSKANSNQEPAPAPGACHDHDCHGCGGHEGAPGELNENIYAQLESLLKLNKKQKSESKVKKEDFKFWKTQPVPDFDEFSTENRPIEEDKPLNEIKAEPYKLPPDYSWDEIDIFDDSQLTELYELLTNNYVQDEDNLFRFDYSKTFLKWALSPPGYCKKWHCCIRFKGKMFGFIAAIPTKLIIHGQEKNTVEINFLCVHESLRKKRMAPILILEITRRVNRRGIFQAVYTSGTQLPRPVTSATYWHRPLNPAKLVECRFSSLSGKMTVPRLKALYKLPAEFGDIVRGTIKPLTTVRHMKEAHEKLCTYLKQFKIYQTFSYEDFKHWFNPIKSVIYSYVVVDSDDKVTDMFSFYALPSTVFGSSTHDKLHSAYSFYNFTSVNSWDSLMKCALIAAKNEGFDVFNALDLMQNAEFLKNLIFGIGDGNLRYYIYNWICPTINPGELALVLQ